MVFPSLQKVLTSMIWEMVCVWLPLFIFTSLLSMLWKNGTGFFLQLWKPVVITILIQCGFILVCLLYVSIKLHVSACIVIKKILVSVIMGISTSSSLAAFSTGNEINKKKLGIHGKYSDLAYPLGISFYDAGYIVVFIVITYYLAEIYQTQVSVGWLITAGIISLLITYTSPQVSGGILVGLGILLSQLGIPSEALAIAGTLALLLDFSSTGAKVASQHLEMILQADHLDLIDREVLRNRS